MGQIRYYRCSFTSIGQYFLGGEKTFPIDPKKQEHKKVYYIASEDFPSQSTIFGTIRFMLLEKAGLLNNGSETSNSSSNGLRARQDALIGSDGFSMDKKDFCNSYGILKRISPIFIYDKKSGNKLIPAPLNHKKREKKDSRNRVYEPLSMKYLEDVQTESGKAAFIPDNYDAKAGLSDGFLSLDRKNSLIRREEVIGTLTQTRTARDLDEGGFFKMDYKYLKEEYAFSVMVEIEIPESTKDGAYEPFKNQGIVYMGMEKSTFRYDVSEIGSTAFCELENDIKGIRMSDMDNIEVYYALSDCYKKKSIENSALYWILQKTNLRTLEKQKGIDYRSSMKKSRLYQMIRAGSVFYVQKGEQEEKAFLEQFDCPGLAQIGLNHILKTGVIKDEQ